jgi:hypothetical protein
MIEYLNEHVPSSCAELVFDVDEVGISEWEDQASREGIVPISMTDQTIHHGRHRNLKPIFVICCVSVAVQSVISFMVSSQVNDKVIEQLKIEGFRMGVDMILEHRQKPYITATLFQQYATTVSIPFIERLRTNQEFIGKSPILLMDNWSIHTKPEILATLRKHNVKIITFPPHTTQIFQTLDLCPSGLFERKMQTSNPDNLKSIEHAVRKDVEFQIGYIKSLAVKAIKEATHHKKKKFADFRLFAQQYFTVEHKHTIGLPISAVCKTGK